MREKGWFQSAQEMDEHLPPQIRGLLLVGSTGKSHLLSLGLSAFNMAGRLPEASRPHAFRFGLDMLQAAWESDPLDGECAGNLVEIAGRLSRLGIGIRPETAACAGWVAEAWKQAGDARPVDDPAWGADPDQACPELEAEIAAEPGNLYFWRKAHEAARRHCRWAWLSALLERSWPTGGGDLAGLLRAECAFGLGEHERARELLVALHDRRPMPLLLVRAGEAARRAGDHEAALALHRRALKLRPWDTNLILGLHDRLRGIPGRRGKLDGRVAILLYSYNKRDTLERTLESLFASDIGQARVIVLDNGSADGTGAMLEGWQARVGQERLGVVALPINIGAPAARNWLKHLPEVREADWAAYLDDDVILPADWLAGLAAAAEAYPGAGVWGCKVVDHDTPQRIQVADTHLLYASSHPDHLFMVSALQNEDIDHGQFDYLRPCSHVTGCCHLFAGSVLRGSADFDLRFSPSQWDDLDHDLQLQLAGRPVVYNGHVRVRHAQKSGRQAQVSGEQQSRMRANFDKLQGKYDRQRLDAVRRVHLTALEEDFLRKRQALREALAP